LGVGLLIGLCGCLTPDPSTGGTTDISDTDGGEGTTGASETGIDGGVDETAGAEPVADHRTYYIGESVKFDGGGECEGSRLNTVTRRLQRRLNRAGWTGLRLVGSNTWLEEDRTDA
jgi:hypothetical protein